MPRMSFHASFRTRIQAVRWHAAVLALALCVFAPHARAQRAEPANSGAEAALRIDGEAVPLADYAEWLLSYLGEDMAEEYAHGTYLIAREARRTGVDVTDAELEAHVQRQIDERIRGAFHGVKEEWLAELQRTGRSEGGLRSQRRAEELPKLQGRAIAAIDRVVPREKIEREWWLRYGRHGFEHDLSMMKFGVVVESRTGATRDEIKAEETKQRAARLADARAVRERLVQGADFGQLAQENSTDPDTRAQRGRPTGGFDHQGWPSSFLDAIEALKVGELSQPIYARGGWWLVLVRGRTETPLARVQDAIAADLLVRGPEDDEVELVRQRVRAGVQVEVLPGLEHPDVDPELASPLVPALSIDGERVTRGTYARWLLHLRGEAFAHTFVEDWLLARRAAAAGITVGEDEIRERSLEFVRGIIDTEHGRDRERWLEMLTTTGRTEEEFLRRVAWRLRSNLLAEKLLVDARKVTEAELRAAFGAAYGDDGVRREVSLIAISSRPEALARDVSDDVRHGLVAKALDDARVKALALAVRARAGADFAQLAREFSDHQPTSTGGGKLPGRFTAETFTPEICAAVSRLPAGAVSDPLVYGPTWYVFRIDSLREVTFSEVRDELEHTLRTRRPTLIEVMSYRNSLAKPAKVEVLPAMWQ